MRINKYIASCGICSRRAADVFIEQRKVKINGVKAERNSVVKEDDVVTVKGMVISKPQKEYWMLNKPTGYLSATSDKFEKTIVELINTRERIFPLGRLDKDTEGLILLTNDGDVFNSLMHPRSQIYKEYYVKLDKKVLEEDIEKIKTGIYLPKFGFTTLPAKVTKKKFTELYLSISQGKKRQIRRLFGFLGYEVLYLKRISIGKIKLGNLNVGENRPLMKEEIEWLRSL